jgi:hypothetical protein
LRDGGRKSNLAVAANLGAEAIPQWQQIYIHGFTSKLLHAKLFAFVAFYIQEPASQFISHL